MNSARLVRTLFVGVWLSACATEASGPPAVAASAAVLKTVLVATEPWTPELALDGTLEPVASVQLGFDVPGRIEVLHVRRGAVVARGEVLAKLDDAKARAQLAQAEAATSGAEAQLAAGEAAWSRAQQLKAAGGLSDQQSQDAEAAVLAGRAGVAQARAAVQLARAYVANHTLVAPIAGTITNGPDNIGAMVGGGTPLFFLEDLSALQLRGSVSEGDTWVAAGMPVSVSPGTPGSTLSVQASVLRVIPALDPVTRRLPVEVSIDPVPAGFLAHGYARATIRASEPVPVLSVPRAALVARPDFSVVVDRGAGTYERVSVEVLGEHEETALVRGKLVRGKLAGGKLAEGDRVVLYPPGGLGGEG